MRAMLTVADREEISRGLAEGLEYKQIGVLIGRNPSVVSREVARHGGRSGYRAATAEVVAGVSRRRPKTWAVERASGLREVVVERLRLGWSPASIAGRLVFDYPDDHLEYTVRGFTIRDRRLRLAGGIGIRVVWSRELPSDPTSVRVYRDLLGHWYASFVVRREVVPAPAADKMIGVDWGVTTTATTTSPAYDLPYLGHRKRCAAELAKVQRRMSRRRRPRGSAPSKGYLRAKRQAAKLHKKAARQNAHDARQWAKKVVDNHSVIAVEDFKPTFLTRTTMARKVADAAIGAAKRELIDRGTRAGRKVVLVPPAYTTMTCSECGTRTKERLGLGVRTFRCDGCGYTACRDRNAARAILATVERDRAGADDVRRAITTPRGGGAVRSEPEIPRLSAMGKR